LTETYSVFNTAAQPRVSHRETAAQERLADAPEDAMSVEVISILVLVAIFVIATVTSVHMGALAIVATFIVGTFVVGGEFTDPEILADGFPGDLFIILAGVTLLFAIAKNNGTVDWLVHAAVRAVGGRVVLMPWVMFLITALLTAVGAVVPAAVAIIAPIGMRFATRYRINPLLMGLMVINGATAGGFSPISIFGAIVNGVVERNDLASNPLMLFVCSFVFNVVLGVISFLLFGGRELARRGERVDTDADAATDGQPGAGGASGPGGGASGASGAGTAPGGQGAAGGTATATAEAAPQAPVTTLDTSRKLTLAGIAILAVGALSPLELDVGFCSFTIAVLLMIFDQKGSKGAIHQIAWPTVLLVCGIVTYVTLLEEMGTIEFLGNEVAQIGAPMVAAVLICYIGGVVSAFASTTGILGALIPLAVPFLETGEVGAVGMIVALSISSSVVDSSPFSTSGSLVVANAPEEIREHVFKQLMRWGFTVVAVAPTIAWGIFVLPGWL
jgi:di/tricarboxylate transporter